MNVHPIFSGATPVDGSPVPPIDDYSIWYAQDPIARFVVDPDATLRGMNDAGREMVGQGYVRLDPHGRIRLPRDHRSAVDVFQRAAASGLARHVYHLSPARLLAIVVRRAGADQRLQLCATLIALDRPLDLSALIESFGISDSEAPVLTGLAEAVCPKETSRALGLSIHTIRSHLRSIYAKLGVRSSAEAQRIVLQIYFSSFLMNDPSQ